MIYKKEENQSGKKLPRAPNGIHTMQCVLEQPSKYAGSHSFLFKNKEYEIFYNPFINQLPELAKAFGFEDDADHHFDTSKLLDRWAIVTVGDKETTKKRYENIVLKVEETTAPIVPEISLEDIPF